LNSPRTFEINEGFAQFLLNQQITQTASSDASRRVVPSYSRAVGTVFGHLKATGFVVLKGCGADFPTDALFGCVGYERFVDSLGRPNVPLKSNPFSKNISETTREGFFHTDYTVHAAPPEYTVIRCLSVDPRHPFYGRNQVARAEDIAAALYRIDPLLVTILCQTSFPMTMLGKEYNVIPLSRSSKSESNKFQFRIHVGYIDESRLMDAHVYQGLPIHKLLELVAMQVCCDFALDKDDLLIVSNTRCLHRRGPVTIEFCDSIKNFSARQIDTWRYARSSKPRIPPSGTKIGSVNSEA
jgi:hypothetical protein